MEEIRVWKANRRDAKHLLVYRDADTKHIRVTYMDGKAYENTKSLIDSHEVYAGGFWGRCRDMGDDLTSILENLKHEIEAEKLRYEQEQRLLAEEREAREKAEREAEELRKYLVNSKTRISVAPIDVLQSYCTLELNLEQLKAGEYYVCINYKKSGYLDLRTKARESDHLKVLAKVTRDEKLTKASLHRFAVAVRKAYEEGITIIGKTHALKSFGKKIVDAAPCIKESINTYYSSAAPRQFYDKNTLVYLKLEQIEKNDK